MKQLILRIVLLPILLGLLLFMFGAVVAPPSAHAASMTPAGSNGQQLAISTYSNSVIIDGYNQSGSHVRVCVNTPAVPPNYNGLYGYWWKGNVYIYFYRNTGCSNYKGSVVTYVPTSQNGDWWYVSAY